MTDPSRSTTLITLAKRRQRRAKGGDRRRAWPKRRKALAPTDPQAAEADPGRSRAVGIDPLVTAFIAASNADGHARSEPAPASTTAADLRRVGGSSIAPGEAPAGAGSPPAPIFSGSNSSGGGMTAVMQSSVSPSRDFDVRAASMLRRLRCPAALIDFRPGPRAGSRRRGDAEPFERPARRPRGRIRIRRRVAARSISISCWRRRGARPASSASPPRSAVLLGLAYTVTAAPKYTATTDILIDSQKDQNALSASIAELTFDTGAIDSQVEVMKSEKIALSVISTLNLTHDPEFMGARGTPDRSGVRRAARRRSISAAGSSSREKLRAPKRTTTSQRAAIDQLDANLDVRRVARTYVLAIDYTSPDRVKAATIANAFAEAYLTDQLDAKFEATRRAAGWLQTRIADLKQQSLDADFAVQKFKADKGIVVTGGDKPGLMSDQQLTELNEQIGAGARRHRPRRRRAISRSRTC